MKIYTKAIFAAAVITSPLSALGGKYVDGYVKKDGTQVQGHYRSSPDSYRHNNKNSQTLGGKQRDEFSSGTGATNKSNPTYRLRDNDNDGVFNSYDSKPEKKSEW